MYIYIYILYEYHHLSFSFAQFKDSLRQHKHIVLHTFFPPKSQRSQIISETQKEQRLSGTWVQYKFGYNFWQVKETVERESTLEFLFWQEKAFPHPSSLFVKSSGAWWWKTGQERRFPCAVLPQQLAGSAMTWRMIDQSLETTTLRGHSAHFEYSGT